jgi:8-oxo-dGTP pyrophosphatase MutT (NUDIX family)
VLLVDGAERILLLHGRDPNRPDRIYWFTPGGGLDVGETAASAAARELYEEVGRAVDPAELGEPVWQEEMEFSFHGRWHRQTQEFFLLRVESHLVDLSGMDEVEAGCIDGYRWWSVPELERTAETYYPAHLPVLLRSLFETRD